MRQPDGFASTHGAGHGFQPAPPARLVRLFVRQGLTETGPRERATIQSVLDLIVGFPGVDVITGAVALDAGSFKASHEAAAQSGFSPSAFRDRRLALLSSAHAMVVIRTGMSESTAFEIAYNIFGGARLPIFFAVHEQAAIKTTLLQELGALVPTVYAPFGDPKDLRSGFSQFLDRIRSGLPAEATHGAGSSGLSQTS